MEGKSKKMRNQYGYGAFCTWERNHIGAVRGALYSIADTIEQHSRESMVKYVFL